VCVCVCVCVTVSWTRYESNLVCDSLMCVAAGCNALQCVAVCCNVLQCVAECYSVLQCVVYTTLHKFVKTVGLLKRFNSIRCSASS